MLLCCVDGLNDPKRPSGGQYHIIPKLLQGVAGATPVDLRRTDRRPGGSSPSRRGRRANRSAAAGRAVRRPKNVFAHSSKDIKQISQI